MVVLYFQFVDEILKCGIYISTLYRHIIVCILTLYQFKSEQIYERLFSLTNLSKKYTEFRGLTVNHIHTPIADRDQHLTTTEDACLLTNFTGRAVVYRLALQ